MSEKTCIAVRKMCCGRIFYVCAEEFVDEAEKKVIRSYARIGCRVERMTLDAFNKEGMVADCECGQKSLKAARVLLGEEKP